MVDKDNIWARNRSSNGSPINIPGRGGDRNEGISSLATNSFTSFPEGGKFGESNDDSKKLTSFYNKFRNITSAASNAVNSVWKLESNGEEDGTDRAYDDSTYSYNNPDISGQSPFTGARAAAAAAEVENKHTNNISHGSPIGRSGNNNNNPLSTSPLRYINDPNNNLMYPRHQLASQSVAGVTSWDEDERKFTVAESSSSGTNGSSGQGLPKLSRTVSGNTSYSYNFGEHLPGYSVDREPSSDSESISSASGYMLSKLDTPSKVPAPIRTAGLGKEFWMKDENATECFKCGKQFSAWRRKHHCRLCGQIFCSSCTTLTPGEQFNYSGKLRACLDCLDVMEKYGSSSSIGDSFPSSPVDNDDSNHQTGETDFNNTTNEPHSDEQQQQQQTISFVENTPKPTPRMAIPATRKGEALEIFPSSNSNSSNYNNYSNHLHPTNASNRTRRRAATIDGSGQRSGLHQVSNHSSTPADEEVVASDDDRMATQDDDNNNNFGAEESEEDEQAMSLFTALNSAKVDTSEPRIDPSGSRNTFLRPRSGTTRSSDYTTGNNSNTNNSTHHHQKPSLMRIGQRRKTFSSNGGRKATISRSKSSIIYRDSTNHRPSLSTGSSPKKGSNLITTPTSARSGGTSFDEVGNKLKGQHNHHHHHHNYYHPPKMLTTGAENDTTQAPSVDLNKASINHAKAFLNQLLWNYELSEKWEMVLVEPLLKCAQNIDLNVKGGDSIDIRHYVKLKRVSGGSLKDTKYVDGIVFSKTLALKTMARTIEEPRILLITFPIEYSRAGNHFMSLEPVIAQETEYLRKLVRRITALRPQVILAGDRVSGIALKMLSDNGIAVATDVKNTVINRVSRYTRADIISSIDKLAVKPTLGKCERFEVKTYRYRDTAKSFMFLTGIPKELGCTILLRGSDAVTLAKVKAVTEFMVYVVFNLKLETSLMRDEFVLIPSKDPQEQADTNYGTPAEQDNPGYFHGLLKMQARKILSSSPFVNFGNPYFFQEARDLEDRLVEMSKENESLDLSDEKNIAESYHKLGLDRNLEDLPGTATYAIDLIKAVNNQRYQRLHELWTVYKRQWEQMYAQYPDMFDPSSHQNIVVLFSIVCNETATPCVGPEKLTIDFYSENDVTLGQFVEHICVSADDDCPEECGKHLLGHYRSYVHGKGRVNIVLEKLQSRLPGYQDTILMWSWCKICQITTPIVPMSGTTWKYSFGKYLELSFWSTGLSFRAGVCNHDIYRDHIRYFGFHDMAVRFQYDPVGLLEVVAPKAKLIWNPEKDIKHKLEVYDGIIKRVNRFWDSVANRLNNVIIEGLEPEKMEECKAKVDELRQRCEEERGEVLEMVKSIYLTSGVTDLLPLNGALRTIQDKVVMWDSEFIQFESKYLPSEKDVARITAQQLKKIFIDKQDDTTPDPLETPSSEKDLKSDITPPVSSAASSIVKTTDEKREEPVDDVDTGEKVEQQASKSTDCIPADNPTDDEFLYSKTAADPVKYHSNEITSVSEPVTRAASPKRESNTPGGRVKEEVSRMEETMAKQRKEQQVGYFFRKPTSDRAQLPSTPEIDDSEIENGENSLFLSNSMQPMDENTIPKGENLDNSTESVKDTDEITKEDGLKQAKRSSQTSTKSTDESYRRPISFEKSRGSSIPTLKPGAEKTSSTLGKSTPVSQPPAEGKRVRSNNNNNQSASSLSFRKRFSDKISLPAQTLRQRFGSSTKELEKQLLKNSKQPGQTKVSSLAKHFDQLSKEFEKERAKERSIIEQGRVKAFPVARARPVVEVFKNVEEAVEELSDHEDDKKKMNNIKGAKSTSDTLSSRNDNYSTQYIDSSGGRQHLHNKDTENLEESNDKTSETDGTQVETDHSTLPTDSSRTNSEAGLIPEKETAEHTAEKQTLMQTLARFWADRTSSGWESLDYPMNPTEHIFADSDIIIREDEPSSLIAFCLNSPDYLEKLKNMGQNKAQKQPVELDELVPENASSYINETDNALESQMLKKTGIHLKYQFQEGTANMSCKIFFSEQFDAFRKQAGCDEHYIQSLSRCVKWDSSGGKSGSAFLKTLDDRLVVKQLSPSELDAFVKFAPSYFEYMAQAFFHVLPTVLAKIFGFYQIQIRNPITGKTIKMDLIVMENLFYNRKMNRIFDLKGSMRNRHVQQTGKENEVLLDENMVEYIYESPLFVREYAKKLLRTSLFNDTLFLAKMNVMDYSLVIGIDEDNKELVVGIIDFIRTFTWDKKLESWVKERGLVGKGVKEPTVVSPRQYKNRFRESMERYVLMVPE